jgi:ubiquinone/menaquinone biosynthesis C-methylase UbiE
MAFTFQDLFSQHAAAYAAYRPDYPSALFSYLAKLAPSHELAWDCGTGNGQAAVALADYFTQVIATDPSEQQIKAATSKKNISYRVMPAEQTNLEDQSIDLITVAQALHWFKFAEFYQEVNRVLKPNGILAAWCYSLGRVNPAVDKIIDKFYDEITKPYWVFERHYIDENYKTIPFPLHKLTPPQFHIKKNWDLAQFTAYLNTWSAVKIGIKQTGHNPLELINSELQTAWGDPQQTKLIHWPIHLLVGKTHV